MKHSFLPKTAMAVAAAASGISTARAADPVIEPVYEPPVQQYYFSVEGSVVFAKPSVDKVGADPDTDVGLYAGVAFGREITPVWDWRVGLAFTNFQENTSEYIREGEATLSSELRFATADLEAGYTAIETDATRVRFFGGLRVLWEDDTAEAQDSGASLRQDGDFLGIGPRVGVDFETRFADSRFGLSGMAAYAAIWGKRDVKFTSEYLGSESFDESQTVQNLEGNLGVDYHWTDTSKFTLGYRAQQWWNLRNSAIGGMEENDVSIDEDVLVHGPFLKYTAVF